MFAAQVIDRRPPGQSYDIDAIVYSRSAVDANGQARRFVVNDAWKDRTRRAALAGGSGGWQTAPARLALLLTARRQAIAQTADGDIARGTAELLQSEVNAVVGDLIDELDGQTSADLDAQGARIDLTLTRGAPLAADHAVIWARFRPILEKTGDWSHVVRLATSADELAVLARELPLAVVGDELSAPVRQQTTEAIAATIANAAKSYMSAQQLRAVEESATLTQRRSWWQTNVAMARYEVNTGENATVLIGWDREVIRVP